MTTQNTITRPNFFILLELDPDAAWSQANFETLLSQKRNEWSRLSSSVGQKALKAKQNLALIPEIERVMSDETSRKVEADSARAMLNVQRKGRREEFQRQLRLINAAKSITQEELNNFIKAFQDISTADEIKWQINVPIRSEAEDATILRPLDPSMAKRIAGLLEVVNKKSLYDVLQLSEMTGTKELHDAADKLYQEMGRRMPKSAEVTAYVELAGLAMEIFKTEEMRKRYDESVRQSGLDNLLKDVEDLMSRSVSKRLEAEQVQIFLDDAQKSGWRTEEALSKLEEQSMQHRWILRPPGADDLKPKIKCGKCGNLNVAENKKCTSCGLDLYIPCPNCGQRVTSDQKACGNCGFPVGNRFKINDDLNALDEQLKTLSEEPEQESLARADELNEIKQSLEVLEKSWPQQNADELSRKMKDTKAKVEAIERVRQEVVKSVSLQLDSLMDKKKFRTAQDLLEKKGEFIPPSEKQAKQQIITARIAQAEKLMQQVHSQNLSPNEKIVKLRAILQVCADYEDAQDMLKQSPISPPSDLQARKDTASVTLTWQPSSTPDVTYTIVRSLNDTPTSPKGGISLGTISDTTFVDAKPVIGRSLYYAVFAGFESAVSNQCASLSEPVLLTAEVSNVKTQARNLQVELTWDNPQYVDLVIVMRHPSSHPSSEQDGVRVPLQNATEQRAIDRDLVNGRTYYYGIYCQFKDRNGRLFLSNGTFVKAIPIDPPLAPFLNIEAEKQDEGVEIKISWNYSDKGDVAILKSDSPVNGPAPQVVPESDLGKYGQVLPSQPDGAIDSWTGPAYYTPTVIYQKMAYLGTSQRFVYLEGLKNVECHNLRDGSGIVTTWEWPPNCDEVQIFTRSDDYPLRYDDPDAEKHRIDQLEYERKNGFYLRGIQEQTYFIILYAMVEEAGKLHPVESGRYRRTQRRKRDISYEIVHRSFPKGCYLLLTGDLDGTPPAMELYGKYGTPPLRKKDGRLIKTIDIPHGSSRRREYKTPELGNFAPNTFGYVFLQDKEDLESVILRHPDTKKLRLD